VTATEQPEPGDLTVVKDGATIYLDPTATEQLDDQILDAAVDQDGRVQFALAPQA
jgi:iron-sulfur cluster assembly protein